MTAPYSKTCSAATAAESMPASKLGSGLLLPSSAATVAAAPEYNAEIAPAATWLPHMQACLKPPESKERGCSQQEESSHLVRAALLQVSSPHCKVYSCYVKAPSCYFHSALLQRKDMKG